MPKTTLEAIAEVRDEVSALRSENELLRENYVDAARALIAQDDIGWTSLVNGVDVTERFDLGTLKTITEKLQEWTDTNPLLSRGNEIRCSYLYGRPYDIGTVEATSKISVRAMDEFNHPANQDAVFSLAALQRNERARYTDGNIFALFDKAKRTFSMIPLSRIDDAYYNPDDPGEVWMYLIRTSQRVYNPAKQAFEQQDAAYWVPTDTFTAPPWLRRLRSLAKNKIEWGKVIVDDRLNRVVGQTWGMPDSFSASPWAIAYSRYMKDGVKVQQALAEWVWAIKPKKASAAPNTAATVRATGGAAAKTVVTDADMTALPKAGMVNLNEGRPLAAQVAAALGVSVVILLADPGQSGAYGTAQTLTDPTIRTMQARREVVTDFLRRCLKLLGIKDPAILWRKMAQDPDHREMQTMLAAQATGAFHDDEWRAEVAELAGFTLKHEGVPDGYMPPNNANSLNRLDVDADSTASATSKATGQGGASLTAKPSYGDHSLRDMDTEKK